MQYSRSWASGRKQLCEGWSSSGVANLAFGSLRNLNVPGYKSIEREPGRCEMISTILDKTVVVHGGMHLYRAEFSGAQSEKLTPRVAETATSLWGIYVALTLALVGLLVIAGMEPFDAVAHAFATLPTAGFSTRTASMGAFNSPAIEYTTIAFMILGGASFILHYRALLERRPLSALRDHEFRHYLGVICVSTAAIAVLLYWQLDYASEKSLRTALFQVTPITTTTGFATDDFEYGRHWASWCCSCSCSPGAPQDQPPVT